MNWSAFFIGATVGALGVAALGVVVVRHDNARHAEQLRLAVEAAEAVGAAKEIECLASLKAATERLSALSQTGTLPKTQ